MASVVTGGQVSRGARDGELRGLNEAERRVLLLLAEGHTAKSVASELDTTTAAVNERLREARRKTGVGSSRELARLLKAQENRHEQIGVGSGRLPGAALSQSDAEARRPQRGVFAMSAFLLAAAAAAAAFMWQGPSSTNQVDPLIGEALPKFTDPSDLHRKVRAERRDPEWASKMEDAINARVSQIPLIGKNGNVLRVLCGSTLCEIGGTLIAPPKAEQEDQNSQFSRTIKDLQVSPFTDDIMKLGLKVESGTFTGAKGKPDRTAFFLYYSRAKPKI